MFHGRPLKLFVTFSEVCDHELERGVLLMVRGVNVAQLHNGMCEDESWFWAMGMFFQMSFCRIHLCRGFAQAIIMEKLSLVLLRTARYMSCGSWRSCCGQDELKVTLSTLIVECLQCFSAQIEEVCRQQQLIVF